MESFLFIIALASLTPAAAQARSEPAARGEPPCDLEVEMRDGTTLLADLWRPVDREEPFPVLLIRTPYGRSFEKGPARSWTQRGYGVVVQAVRGRDGSEGTWIPWEHELEDGYDTIDWLTRQSWCNGRVGMTGGSYLGHVQVLAAACGHPALACVVPSSPGSDGFSDVPFSGGILRLGLLGWLYSCRDPVLDQIGRLPASARDRNLELLPLPKIDEAWLGFRSHIWQHWTRIESLADMPGLSIWDRLAESEHKVPTLRSEWFPDDARNPGTLEPMATATRTAPQRNRIHSGAGAVSALRLHRVPLDHLQGASDDE